jgi:ABC-2 type transport system ATP-binding protein
MNIPVSASDLRHRFGAVQALDGISFDLAPGRILGLLGPNGAGKTTLLRALLGLQTVQGKLSVMGKDPRQARHTLMNDMAFIADVATLPRWLKVKEAVDFMAGVHPRFDRFRCETFLARTQLRMGSRVKELSKGMVVQLHLALVMAIDAKLLVLDEPTLGLDPLYRKSFYRALLEDYMDGERTLIISTHQVEEVAGILTDVAFMRAGQWIAHLPMEAVAQRFVCLAPRPDAVEAARALNPLEERSLMGRALFLFDGVPQSQLALLGEIGTPPLEDIFVALMGHPHRTGARS